MSWAQWYLDLWTSVDPTLQFTVVSGIGAFLGGLIGSIVKRK